MSGPLHIFETTLLFGCFLAFRFGNEFKPKFERSAHQEAVLTKHIDRGVAFVKDVEFKELYDWCLQELDDEGNRHGPEQIPWNWSLYFSASKLALTDTLSLDRYYQSDNENPKTISQPKHVIRVSLQPGLPNHDWSRRTTYSMFGTSRTISHFELFIEETNEGAELERCEAWGAISCTTEIDFRTETLDDRIIFSLYVRPGTFAKYAKLVETAAIDELTFRVAGVSGFYAMWSPSNSTSEIKVLTGDSVHMVKLPRDCSVDLPRLGKVKRAELQLSRIRNLVPLKSHSYGAQSGGCSSADRLINGSAITGTVQKLEEATTKIVGLLSALKLVGWIIAGLLVLGLAR